MISAKIEDTSATWFRRKYKLWQPWRNKTIMFGVLSLAPGYVGKIAGTSLDVSSDISVSCKPLRWAGTCMDNQPPCFRIRKGEDTGRKRKKNYIYLDVTHTHTHEFLKHTYFYRDEAHVGHLHTGLWHANAFFAQQKYMHRRWSERQPSTTKNTVSHTWKNLQVTIFSQKFRTKSNDNWQSILNHGFVSSARIISATNVSALFWAVWHAKFLEFFTWNGRTKVWTMSFWWFFSFFAISIFLSNIIGWKLLKTVGLFGF